jgi:predicted alpha/beta hydrolase family esterase
MLLLNVWQTQYLHKLTDAIAIFFAYHPEQRKRKDWAEQVKRLID